MLGFGWDAPANRSAIADIQTAREQVQICANGVGAEVGVGVVAFAGSATGDGVAEAAALHLRKCVHNMQHKWKCRFGKHIVFGPKMH